MSEKILNKSFGLDNELSFVEGKGGFPYIKIDNEYATALISVYGAHVLSFKLKADENCDADNANKNDNDMFFVSEKASYEEGKAIRGGIPICWPWFGRSENPDIQIHGFARNMLWQMEDTVSEDSGNTKVVLSLTESEDSYKLWPHDFKLVLTVIVGKTLNLSLETTNTGKDNFSFTQAMHPYFSISDINKTRVVGLDKITYFNKVVGSEGTETQVGDIKVDQEVDRIYTDAPSEAEILDLESDRKILIKSKGSKTTVVWNPWIEISKRNVELADDAYMRFICVETANAVEDFVTIAPNESHTIEAEYSMS